jgi:hypothetical protein
MLDAADRLDVRQTGITRPGGAGRRVARRRTELPADRRPARHQPLDLRTTARAATSTPQSFFDFRVWVRALCAIGLRIDEACRARRSDVDLVAGCLRVGHAKTPAGVRSVQLTPDTASDLQRYLAMTADHPADGPLLPTRRGTFHNRNNAQGITSVVKTATGQYTVTVDATMVPGGNVNSCVPLVSIGSRDAAFPIAGELSVGRPSGIPANQLLVFFRNSAGTAANLYTGGGSIGFSIALLC